MKNANIDLCGIMILLRKLRDSEVLTDAEARRIAVDIAVRNHADIILSEI